MAMDLVLSFPDEHKRIMRALKDSLDRESEQQRIFRRMKEALVGTCLRLQVATKTVAEDELTIQQLRRELEESRKDARTSTTAAKEASDIISDLRIELSGLKRRLHKLESAQQQQSALKAASGLDSRDGTRSDDGAGGESETFNDYARPPPGDVLDEQVDAMFDRHKMRDGGFALDARAQIEAMADWTFDDDGEGELIAEARRTLREGEREVAFGGSGSGLGEAKTPSGLVGHPAVMSRSLDAATLQALGAGGSILNRPLDWSTATSQSSNVGGATKGDITAFQHWKMKNFLWAPDTPEASKQADKWAVERLTDKTLLNALSPNKGMNSEADPILARLRKPIDSNVTKVNETRLMKARAPAPQETGPLGLPTDGAGRVLGPNASRGGAKVWGSVGKFPPSLKPGHGIVAPKTRKGPMGGGGGEKFLRPLHRGHQFLSDGPDGNPTSRGSSRGASRGGARGGEGQDHRPASSEKPRGFGSPMSTSGGRVPEVALGPVTGAAPAEEMPVLDSVSAQPPVDCADDVPDTMLI